MKPLYTNFFICLLASLSSCYHEKDYQSSNLDFSNSITLAPDISSLPADGTSSTFITVTIPFNSRSDLSAAFLTNKGSFENGTQTISKPFVMQTLNGKNLLVARTQLISSNKIETATIQASVQNFLKTTQVSFTNLKYDTLLVVKASTTNIPADGVSSASIEANQPLNITDDYSAITFTTNKGTFENNSQTITKSSVLVLESGVYKRKAIAKLFGTTKVDSATVTVGIKNWLQNLKINFVNAAPDTLTLKTSSLSIAPGYNNSITLTTTLIRSVGQPSQNNTATLTVYDVNGSTIGSFINYLTKCDDKGIIANTFTLGAANYHGDLKIVATTKNASGKLITTSITIVSP